MPPPGVGDLAGCGRLSWHLWCGVGSIYSLCMSSLSFLLYFHLPLPRLTGKQVAVKIIKNVPKYR